MLRENDKVSGYVLYRWRHFTYEGTNQTGIGLQSMYITTSAPEVLMALMQAILTIKALIFAIDCCETCPMMIISLLQNIQSAKSPEKMLEPVCKPLKTMQEVLRSGALQDGYGKTFCKTLNQLVHLRVVNDVLKTNHIQAIDEP